MHWSSLGPRRGAAPCRKPGPDWGMRREMTPVAGISRPILNVLSQIRDNRREGKAYLMNRPGPFQTPDRATPMALTARQRRRINKKNASHSTGPKTEEGRRTASTNSTTHGLRCTVLPPPGPDAAFLADRVQIYNDFYKPQSPVERDLVEQF